MKSHALRIIIILSTVIAVSSIFLFCFKKATKIIITDCNTQKVVSKFYTKDYETEIAKLLILLIKASFGAGCIVK